MAPIVMDGSTLDGGGIGWGEGGWGVPVVVAVGCPAGMSARGRYYLSMSHQSVSNSKPVAQGAFYQHWVTTGMWLWV